MSSSETSSPQTPPDRGLARRVLSVLGAALIAVWASSCFLFVDETEVVIVERLGKIVSVFDRAEDRGLAVKLPWPIGTARRFDRRIQLFDPAGREMFTRDKKNITVDAYLCWKGVKTYPKGARTSVFMDLFSNPIGRREWRLDLFEVGWRLARYQTILIMPRS